VDNITGQSGLGKELFLTDILPLVSIITPAYNRAGYLKETIESVLEQDYPQIEYIVLDDGSTDNTREVLGKYTGRLIWETHPNMGEHRTVNKGWSMAHGEIVAVVNSDDTLLPGAVSTAVAFMQAHPDILVAYPDWNYIGPDSEFISHVQVPEYDYLYMLKRYRSTVGSGAFIRHKAFELAGMRDPEFTYMADFEYWLRLGLYGEFARIPKTLATWRKHPGSAFWSHQGAEMANGNIRLIQKLYSRPDLPPEVRKVRREAYSSAHYFAVLTAGSARWEARKHCLKSFLYHPPSFFGNNEKLMMARSLMLPGPLFLFKTPLWRRMVRPILARGYRFIKQLRKRLRA
jgi:glycosyltransferase involved in cell wall biosynthesis